MLGRMVLEVAVLDVRPGASPAFEAAFREAQPILAESRGYQRHELRRCLEAADRYLLLVWWDSLESHTEGFRGSPGYRRWRELLHPFYDPFPSVEHYVGVPAAAPSASQGPAGPGQKGRSPRWGPSPLSEAAGAAAVEVVEADLGNAAHARGIVEILDAYAREPVGGERPLAPPVRERLVPELAKQAHALVLLAFADARPAGVAVCFRGFSTFAARPLLNIHDLAVLPERRSAGIGRALLAAAEARARALGCCKLTLEVREDNARARGLYRSVGFADYAAGADPMPTFFLEKRL